MTGTQIERFDEAANDELARLGEGMLKSGFFPDAKSAAAAMVKILAGREIGLGPVESMRSLNIVKGKLDLSADLLAQRVKQHPRYDYRVRELDNDHAEIEFFEGDESLGISRFDDADRELAGLDKETPGENGKPPTITPWGKYPRNMMFARAMSNGVAWFCPDVVASLPMPDVAIVDGAGDGAAGSADATAGPAPSTQPDSVVEVGEVRKMTPAKVKHKATQPQLAKLMAIATERGWSDDERHERAGVASFSDLTRSAASLLIEAWASETSSPNTGTSGGEETEAGGEVGGTDDGGSGERDETSNPSSPDSPPATDPDGPPSEELVARARKHLGSGTDGALTVALRQAGFEGTKYPGACTHAQLAAALAYRLDKGKK